MDFNFTGKCCQGKRKSAVVIPKRYYEIELFCFSPNLYFGFEEHNIMVYNGFGKLIQQIDYFIIR